ncbi:hypothetical protein MUK42_10863 [Musa troglodytarum]|uniref:Uncharacterized protein n=1 Tax=Musa troglodytarum TaxID=320322 RepID=A0A9E7FMJ3_9LILI|nr:hypothetical protein MUK42_10863 [Musa troglodytarum]
MGTDVDGEERTQSTKQSKETSFTQELSEGRTSIFKANPLHLRKYDLLLPFISSIYNLHDCKWIKSPATASGIRDLVLSTPAYFTSSMTESSLRARHQLKKCDRRRYAGSEGEP